MLSCSPDGFPSLSYYQFLTTSNPQNILSASFPCSPIYCAAPLSRTPLSPWQPLGPLASKEEECCPGTVPPPDLSSPRLREDSICSGQTKVMKEWDQEMPQLWSAGESHPQGGACHQTASAGTRRSCQTVGAADHMAPSYLGARELPMLQEPGTWEVTMRRRQDWLHHLGMVQHANVTLPANY